MDAADVTRNLSPIGDIPMPTNESQTRPLTQLEPDEQRLVWEVVEKTAPGGKITAAHVKSVVKVLKDVVKTGAIDDGDGVEIPVETATVDHLKAAVTEETYERLKRRETYIQEKTEHKDEKRQERVENILRITEENKELNEGLGVFNLIYADPPWHYEHVETENRAIENHYPTMNLLDILNMPIYKLANDDAVLFLWATSPKLFEAMAVMGAWGFNYRTCMVWVKDKIGMGYYARQRHELLLIGTRGTLPVPLPSNRPDSVIESPRGQHSEKPVKAYELIEKMYPEYRKIELFSRNIREGWHGWGNQYGDTQLSTAA